MPFFLYSTVLRSGETATRAGNFESMEALDDVLSHRGEALFRAFEIPTFAANAVRFLFGRVRPLEVAEFCHSFALYVNGGIDIFTAVGDIANATKNRALKRGLHDMLAQITEGEPVSTAMATTGLFPDFVVGLARIGEQTGALGKMLEDAAIHIERVEAIKSAVKRALIYPGMTLVVMIGAGIFWMAYVVPKIVDLFKDLKVELPFLTRLLIAMSDFTVKYWPLMVLMLVLLPVVFLWVRRHSRVFRLWTDRGLWNAPVLSTVFQGYQYAFYFQYLALMYGAGIVITTALATVQNALTNLYFRNRIEPIEEYLRSGINIAGALSKTGVFEPIAPRMVGIGEQTGKLDEQMQKLADIYFARVQALTEVLGKIIEPIIIAVIGGFFAFFIFALLGPLYDLISVVGQRPVT